MHRYRVEFASKSIDESRLRDFLEQRFGLSEIAVVRGGQSTSGGAGPKNITEEKILALLADGSQNRVLFDGGVCAAGCAFNTSTTASNILVGVNYRFGGFGKAPY